MSMVKRSKVPSGFYNGKQAAERLGLPLATFYHQVKTGIIPKVVPVEIASSTKRPEGFYEKKAIDKIAQERALFTLINSIDPITFSRVETEKDIKGIVDLCIAIYGQGGTPSYDARMEIWQKNPEVYYIVKQEGLVAGYVSLIWFDNEALSTLMGPPKKYSRIVASSAGTGVYSVTGPEHVNTFTERQPIGSLFISLGVRPGFSLTEQREYAFKLLRGTLDVLISYVERGMPVKKLLATSEKEDGIRLARKFRMKEIAYPGDNILRYELDLETTDHPFFKMYREALNDYKQN